MLVGAVDALIGQSANTDSTDRHGTKGFRSLPQKKYTHCMVFSVNRCAESIRVGHKVHVKLTLESITEAVPDYTQYYYMTGCKLFINPQKFIGTLVPVNFQTPFIFRGP
jgi:hypothetical protein